MARDSEMPQQRLTLPTFRISKYPITNAQFAAFVQDNGYTERWQHCWTEAGWHEKGDQSRPERFGGVFDLPNHPVVGIAWYEAVAFGNWLGEILGVKVSLPTEAQWEKAARGTDGRIYPWGKKITPEHANCDATELGATSAVGIFPRGASPYGALDMSGNVWEWCLTKWRADYNEPEDNGLEGIEMRVLRGGSYFYNARGVRCAVRLRLFPDFRGGFGFRVVASLLP
jgi:formylglycine-generating enzyme required for sulfatase activity